MQRGQGPSFVFGAFHGAWGSERQYLKTARYFEAYGHKLIAVRLPIDELGQDYSSMAEAAAKELVPYEEQRPRIIANSRMCNVAALMPRLIDISAIDYVCGTIPATKADISTGKLKGLPIKHGDLFYSGIEYVPGRPGLTQMNNLVGLKTIAFGCLPSEAWEIVKDLRPNVEREEDTVLPERLGIPERAHFGTIDRVVMPTYVKAASLAILGTEAYEFVGAGHLPHVSHAHDFARIMINFAMADYRAEYHMPSYEQ
ncbi:MAG: hypothetical protein JWO41_314 [Candidatus Saccharibacteria bacterium]|nr:hypothetical protein [Candidatus Saccharibacteria bacterium]